MPARILVVDDELLTRRTLQAILEGDGLAVTTVGTAAETLAEVARREYDLILLDILLPDGDGLTCCRQIRLRHRMPIVFLSTKRELVDRVAGLEIGADDYIVKPFEPVEVVARVHAQLRRAYELSRSAPGDQIRVGRLLVDSGTQDALVDGMPAGLTQKEFRLVHLLASRAGRAVSREYLIEQLWANDELASDKNVAVYIRRIRQKIERDPQTPQLLLTVRGFGYKIVPGDLRD
jgi:two-component system alkaline phosphatase synthesis response regulator PhoP